MAIPQYFGLLHSFPLLRYSLLPFPRREGLSRGYWLTTAVPLPTLFLIVSSLTSTSISAMHSIPHKNYPFPSLSPSFTIHSMGHGSRLISSISALNALASPSFPPSTLHPSVQHRLSLLSTPLFSSGLVYSVQYSSPCPLFLYSLFQHCRIFLSFTS